MAIKYKGFNTVSQSKKFRVSGIDLVKRDLLNHFSIRKGEKLMNPEFGSIIWSMLFEPLDEETKKLILDDVTTIANYDPRIAVNRIAIQQLDQGLQLNVELTYIPDNMTTMMLLTFDGNTETLTSA